MRKMEEQGLKIIWIYICETGNGDEEKGKGQPQEKSGKCKTNTKFSDGTKKEKKATQATRHFAANANKPRKVGGEKPEVDSGNSTGHQG